MSLNSINAIFALTPPPQQGQQSTAPFWVNLVPLVLMIVVFYFILIRPQQKKQKEHEALMKNLKAGNKVLTSSGIIGVIITVKDKSITIRTGGDTKLEIIRSAITEVLEKETSEN